MRPFYRAFKNLEKYLSNPVINIVLDSYVVENNGFNDPYVLEEVYESGAIPESERFEIKINGIYHPVFLDRFLFLIDEFKNEIQYNIKFKTLKDSLPDYFTKINQSLEHMIDNIQEVELNIESDSWFYYLPAGVDTKFLKAEGFYPSMIDELTSIFSCIRHNLLTIHDTILTAKESDINNIEITIPEELYSNIKSLKTPTGVLDIYQTAILFYYLKIHKAVNPLDAKNYARMVSALTGHSFQNLRTDSGFGQIANILADKVKNQNYKDEPNYNLLKVRDILNKIISDIDIQMSKNLRT